MKVNRLQSFLLRLPVEEFSLPVRETMLIRVTGSDGLQGYAPGPANQAARQAVSTIIGPFLEGRELADPDALRVQFEDGPARHDPQLLTTYGAVEVALWDLVSKKHGVPLSEVIGGRVRDRIALYASAGVSYGPREYAEQASRIAALGFRAYKMLLPGDPARDVDCVRAMREAAAINLMLGAQRWWTTGEPAWTFETIELVAGQLAEFDPLWLEEPLPPNDAAGYTALKEKDLIPLAGGAHLADAVDYLQMDVCAEGGFQTARRLVGAAVRQGLLFSLRTGATDLDVLVAAHFGIGWEETVIEWLEYPFPPAARILQEPLSMERGELLVPRGPGLGIEVNEDVIEQYKWTGEAN
jgi:D-galactarolactone cycloisomerase